MSYINNDMNTIKWNTHNAMHYFGVMIMTAIPLIPFWFGISLMFLWEIGDGFKPWWYDYKPTGHKLWDLFRRECLYSDKFSLQDVLIWNIGGFGWGMVIRQIIEAVI